MTPSPLPADVVSVIYLCPVCGSKHTYGRDYFDQVGNPDKCVTCETPLDQRDRIERGKNDDHESLLMKRDDLLRKRGEKVPVREKPQDPEALRSQRIKDLEGEIKRLKEGGKARDGIKLGP